MTEDILLKKKVYNKRRSCSFCGWTFWASDDEGTARVMNEHIAKEHNNSTLDLFGGKNGSGSIQKKG
jgi:hypothetical protein